MKINKVIPVEKEVEVYKLPLKKYEELLKITGSFPNRVIKFMEQPDELIYENLTVFISDNLGEFKKIIMLATNLDEAGVDDLSIDELIDIVKAIFEVNSFAEVYEQIKKGIGRYMVAKPAKG